ncbi:UrcA family protein [Erythrobacter sp. THAF29]|uniref:UrcA family protein n=1 Tax=Erythrobacter sp. THAF29 TaxID=2587851 RepID=UPI0012A9260D|nr:UrcA family protein [Erythrobacter sp. THAF29]QFT77848.1 hypothetical protein FIU90_09905 [Erythrobacter sp. THAF29]
MRIALALIASTFAFAATPSLAAGPNATDFDENVKYADIDLTTEKGVSLLDERVKTIIRRKCANGGRDSASIRLERACRKSAFAAAETQVRVAVSNARANQVRLASKEPVAPEA